MKKSILFLITIFFSTLIFGQSLTNDSKLNNSLKKPSLTTLDVNPLFLVMVDSKTYKLDDFSSYDIKSKWIESTVLYQDAKSKQIYGNKNGVVIIYTKKKFRKKVMREIKKNIKSWFHPSTQTWNLNITLNLGIFE